MFSAFVICRSSGLVFLERSRVDTKVYSKANCFLQISKIMESTENFRNFQKVFPKENCFYKIAEHKCWPKGGCRRAVNRQKSGSHTGNIFGMTLFPNIFREVREVEKFRKKRETIFPIFFSYFHVRIGS